MEVDNKEANLSVDDKFVELLSDLADDPSISSVIGQGFHFEEPLSEEDVRSIFERVYSRTRHLAKNQDVWDKWKDWEVGLLESKSGSERDEAIFRLRKLYGDRLQVPHATHEATFQSYSTFVSQNLPPSEYETEMVRTNKLYAVGKQKWSEREAWEDSLASPQAQASPDRGFLSYIRWEQQPRNPDVDLVCCLYERMLYALGPSPDSSEERMARDGAWEGYVNFLMQQGNQDALLMEVIDRATKAVPHLGKIWASRMRLVELSDKNSDDPVAESAEIEELFQEAINAGQIQKNVDDFVAVLEARVDYYRRTAGVPEGEPSQEAIQTIGDMLRQSINLIKTTFAPHGDPQYRLERYLISWLSRYQYLDDASLVWDMVVQKGGPGEYLAEAWIRRAEFEANRLNIKKARSSYEIASGKPRIDWPESIFSAWLQFEHHFGSLQEYQKAENKISRESLKVQARREKEMREAMDAQAAYASQYVGQDAQDDQDTRGEAKGQKRKAGNDGSDEVSAVDDGAGDASHKRAKTDAKVPERDREHSTVFVAGLPKGTKEEELKKLFRDCGDIREIKVHDQEDQPVATVELCNREDVAAALTKDKKVVNGSQIEVHRGSDSTLFITNFPEDWDDKELRLRFEKYGVIFDTRWPSKKFKNSRRFAYLQFNSPIASKSALELDGVEVAPGRSLIVRISDPERKQQRSDAKLDERELFVQGLSRFVKKEDLEILFGKYGRVKDVRVALNADATCKGFAWVDFEDENEAQLAMRELHNTQLKKRIMSVTVTDPHAKAAKAQKAEGGPSGSGQSSRMDARGRTALVSGLPAEAQEAKLQQVVEKATRLGAVKAIEMGSADGGGGPKQGEARVVFENVADLGKLLLRSNIAYDDSVTLTVAPYELVVAGKSKGGGQGFAPRSVSSRGRGRGRGRGGIGFRGHT